MNDTNTTTDQVVDIITAYVQKNSVPATELPALIHSIHKTLSGLSGQETAVPEENKSPAVPIKKSVGTDYITCLEDGRKFKSLKRHLASKYNLTPDEYRAKWGLPKDYPMVAPAYAEARSNLAKKMGLGQGGRMPAKATNKPTGRRTKAV